MPEPDTSGDRDLVQMLERFSSEWKGARGGVSKYPNYKSFTVNIRPPLWPNKSPRFWIGQLSCEVAQRVADGVYYYVGKPPFHFKNANVTYPPLKCIGTVIGIPEVLSTQEMCSRYVKLIAKDPKYEPQRKDFIQKVVEIVTKKFCLPPLVMDGDDGDREEDAPPLEFDEHSARALEMSSSGASHVAGSGLLRGSDPFVPSFEFQLNDSENILRSAGQSLNDCLNTVSEDEMKVRSGNETIEDLSKSSAAQTSTVISNAGEIDLSQCLDDCPNSYDDGFWIWKESLEDLDELHATCRESCEIDSPILNIPPNVCLCASSLSKTMLVSGASVERDVSLGTARGNSEDRYSLQLAVNAKRQKIGG